MSLKIHKTRLQAFSALIAPIARLLEEETKAKSASSAANSSAFQHEAVDTVAQADRPENAANSGVDLQGDPSSFFNEKPEKTRPNSLPMPLGGVQEQATNRRFELVRQELIRHQQTQFYLLPPKTQMLAKVGGLIYQERMHLEQRVYHLVCGGQLIGMIDRKRESLYVRQDISTQDVSDLHCIGKPNGAPRRLAGLKQVQILDCVWLYAEHDPEALLDIPAQAGTHLMSLRRLPKVSPILLQGNQMILIRQLLLRSQGFDQLSKGYTRSQFHHLMRDICCMLLTRSLEFTTLAPAPSTLKKLSHRVVTK